MGAFALFVLSLLCKTVTVTLPAALLKEHVHPDEARDNLEAVLRLQPANEAAARLLQRLPAAEPTQ